MIKYCDSIGAIFKWLLFHSSEVSYTHTHKYNLTARKLQILSCLHLAIIQRFHLSRYCLLFTLISAVVTDCTNKYQLVINLLGRNSGVLFALGKEQTTFKRTIKCSLNILLVLLLLVDLPSTCSLSICSFLQFTNIIQSGPWI